jgi:hypothetical protein
VDVPILRGARAGIWMARRRRAHADGFFRLRRRRSDRGPTSICTCRCTCTCKAYAAPENLDTHHGSVGHRPQMPRSRGVPREEVHDGPTGHRLVQRLGARSRARADDRRLAPATRRSCAEFPGSLPHLHPRRHWNPDRPMAMWTTQRRRSSSGVPRGRHGQRVTRRSPRPACGRADAPRPHPGDPPRRAGHRLHRLRTRRRPRGGRPGRRAELVLPRVQDLDRHHS